MPSPSLPPRELWLFTPGVDQRIPTPVDERGLVDSKKLIDLVKQRVDPSFSWKPNEESENYYFDKHHLYWRHDNYPSKPKAAVNPQEFCNLAVNKAIVPRPFHEFIHLITAEPEVPSYEVMGYRIEAQAVALALFNSARLSRKLPRIKMISEDKLAERMAQEFETFAYRLEEARAIPKEFSLIDVSEFHPESIHDMKRISHVLGEIATKKSTSLVLDVFRPIAA